VREWSDEEATHLRDYWQIIRKRLGLVMTLLLVTVGTTALYLATIVPTFVAETTLLIEPQVPNVLDIREVLAQPLGPEEYDYYKTQYEILRSQTLASRVIREQGLIENPIFNGNEKRFSLRALLSQVISSIVTLPPPVKENSQEVMYRAVDTYLQRLEIRPVTGTRLTKIAFSSSNSQLAAQIANAHATAYIRQGVELRTQANEEASRFLEEKLGDLKDRIEKSEATLNAYRREQQIISLDDKENIVVSRLVDLDKILTEAEAERVALEAQVQFLLSGSYEYVPLVAANPLVQGLKEQLTRLRAEHAALAVEFKPGYPRIDKLKAQVDEAQRRMNEEIRKIGKGLDTAYRTTKAKENELRRRVEAQKEAALKLKDASVTYSILAREVDTNRQLYESVLKRLAEMGVTTHEKTSNTSVIDPATSPRKPAKPQTTLALLLSTVVGLVGGIGAAFFFAYFDNTLKTPAEVERHLQLPTLALVPSFANAKLPSRAALDSSAHPSSISASSSPLLPPQSSRPPLVALEAYRKLRTALLLSRPVGPPRTILFTSATSSEGKTMTAVNTATALAEMGARVLFIDADLRHPNGHRLLNVQNDVGLTEFLVGQLELAKVIQQTGSERLFFLASGSLPPSPSDLLSSKKMRASVAFLRSFYDYIIIDTPPVLPVSDTEILSTMVDGIVLVVDSKQTAYTKVREAQLRLSYPQAQLLGVVLNKVRLQPGEATHYYRAYRDDRQQEKSATQKPTVLQQWNRNLPDVSVRDNTVEEKEEVMH
jgi:polysaccharide biosynthesis transport protein